MKPNWDEWIELITKIRKDCETRISHKQYYEIMLVTYHKAMVNILINKGLIAESELLGSLIKEFTEVAKDMKEKPMLSPFGT